ncbi:MFS family permease [Alkalihalobacillus xiaoxiensis]|uniref:MFS family permease n=1 Tax=Shouchella xiaoxiensis TaxID=766895 RepID=A0ABS2SRL4_9BACI|nr:MFS transporter [Shouchella xiaoxiensis]MBM7837811.1 MFS family permease [Shouchella xiaoxiensis]
MENPVPKPQEEPTRSLWKNRPFLLLIGTDTTSSIALYMYILIIPLLMYELTQSALMMSTLRLIEFFVSGVLGVAAGIFVDRINRKNILVSAALLQWLTIGCLTLLLFTNNLQLWNLYFIGFFFYTSGLLHTNATHAALPQIIHKSQLVDGNAKIGIFSNTVRLIGPLFGGIALAAMSFAGATAVMLGFVTLMLVSVLLLPTLKIEGIEEREKSTFWKDAKEGFHELFQNPLLKITTIVIFFQNFGFSLVMGVLLFFTVDNLQATEAQIGTNISIGAAGGLLGMLVVTKLVRRFPRGKVYTYTNLFDITAFTILAFSTVWWMVAIALALFSFSTAISNVIYRAIRQEMTPNHMLGRVSGTIATIVQLTMPLGFIAGGLWAEFFDIRVLFYANIVLSTIILIVLMRTTFHKTMR